MSSKFLKIVDNSNVQKLEPLTQVTEQTKEDLREILNEDLDVVYFLYRKAGQDDFSALTEYEDNVKNYFTIIGVLECEKQITMANMNNPKGGDEDANT